MQANAVGRIRAMGPGLLLERRGFVESENRWRVQANGHAKLGCATLGLFRSISTAKYTELTGNAARLAGAGFGLYYLLLFQE